MTKKTYSEFIRGSGRYGFRVALLTMLIAMNFAYGISINLYLIAPFVLAHCLHFGYAFGAGYFHQLNWPRDQIAIQFAVNMRREDDWGRTLSLPPSWFNRSVGFKDQPRRFHALVRVLNFVFLVVAPMISIGNFMFPAWIAKRSVKPEVYRGKVVTYTPIIMMTSGQMAATPWVTKIRILHMTLWTAIRYRTSVVILGAHTTPWTSSGSDVESFFRMVGIVPGLRFLRDVVVSHGDTLSVAIAIAQGKEWIDHYELSDEPILVVGGTGMIGQATSEYFALHGHKVVVAGRSEEKIERALESIRTFNPTVDVSGAVWKNGHPQGIMPWAQDVLLKTPTIWLATSSVDELVYESHFDPTHAYVVIDVGAPHNAERSLVNTPNVVVRDGAIATSEHFVKYPAGFEMGAPPHCAYACHSEGITLAWAILHRPELRDMILRDWRLVGTIDSRLIEPILELAKDAGVVPAGPTWYGVEQPFWAKERLPPFAGR